MGTLLTSCSLQSKLTMRNHSRSFMEDDRIMKTLSMLLGVDLETQEDGPTEPTAPPRGLVESDNQGATITELTEEEIAEEEAKEAAAQIREQIKEQAKEKVNGQNGTGKGKTPKNNKSTAKKSQQANSRPAKERSPVPELPDLSKPAKERSPVPELPDLSEMLSAASKKVSSPSSHPSEPAPVPDEIAPLNNKQKQVAPCKCQCSVCRGPHLSHLSVAIK